MAATRKVLSKVLEYGKDILLLCHSYGGVVGSCAVEGLSTVEREKEGKRGGVKLVVYLSAFMIPKGKSLLDMLGGQPLPWMDVQVSKSCPSPMYIKGATTLNENIRGRKQQPLHL